jgi:hypothetical protein
MKEKEEPSERKDDRRKKIKLKSNKRKIKEFEDDSLNRENIAKKEVKKLKESFQDEEWEDWDRYYNH